MPQRDDKKLTPSDLSPIMAMHSDLKDTFQRGMGTLEGEMKELNLTQAGLAKDVEYIKKSQAAYERELREVKSAQLSCKAATGYVGTQKRIGRLERFRDQALQAGVLSGEGTPPHSLPAVQVNQSAHNTETKDSGRGEPRLTDKFIRVSLTLLLGAALGGALLAAAMLSAN
jgi:hypothetical protein